MHAGYLRRTCRSCFSEKTKAYRLANKEKVALWKKAHIEKKKRDNPDCWKEEYQKNRESHKKSARKYYSNHKEEISRKQKEEKRWLGDSYKENRRTYYINSLKEDENHKLGSRLYSQLNYLVRSRSKYLPVCDVLGCSAPVFKWFLEHQFYPHPESGEFMAWDNYGRGLERWHIDHIIPLSFFDLSDEKQLKHAFHISNMQPLWGVDNIEKHTSIPEHVPGRKVLYYVD